MVLATIAWSTLLVLLAVRSSFGMPSSFTLLEHQRGVLFRHGKPLREVGAGRHRVWLGIEKIMFMDTRPLLMSFENRAVTLSDGATAVYGFSGSAEVEDVMKVLYSAGNFEEMPAFVLLCCARLVLNGQSSNLLAAKQIAITDEIVNCAKPRLAASGFRLLNFRMTQLGVAGAAQAKED